MPFDLQHVIIFIADQLLVFVQMHLDFIHHVTFLFISLLATCFAVMHRPAMGWNPCNGFQCHMWAIGEAELRDIAIEIANNGMLSAGYEFFALDDGWQGPRLSDGSITANSSAFPSGTLEPLGASVKGLGLSLGVYTDRGGLTCEKYSGSLGHEVQDAVSYVSWGIR